MVGVIEDRESHMSLDFKQKGDLIFHLGEMSDCMNASEYLANMVGEKNTPALSLILMQNTSFISVFAI